MLVDLNLAARPFVDLRPILKRMRIAIGMLILSSIVLALVLRLVHRSEQTAQGRVHAIDRQISNIQREQESFRAAMYEPENARLRKESERLNQLFNQKAFSWTLVMEDLETVLPTGVKVIAIEPLLTKDGHITLHVRVLGPRDRSIELVQNLEHSKCFLQPRIVSETADAIAAPNQKLGPFTESTPTDFDLLAEYNPDSANAFTALAPLAATPAPLVEPPSADSLVPGKRRLLSVHKTSSLARRQPEGGGLQ